jgi:hypothetical protein
VIIACTVSQIIELKWGDWDSNTRRYGPSRRKLRPNLTKGDTYILIFSQSQKECLHFLKQQESINILYESKPAVNKVPGHGMEPRNTVVVFTLK